MAKPFEGENSDGFHQKRGRNVALSADNLTATRNGDTYDNGVCFSKKPLRLGDIFQLRINEMDLKWAGSLVSSYILTFHHVAELYICCLRLHHYACNKLDCFSYANL